MQELTRQPAMHQSIMQGPLGCSWCYFSVKARLLIHFGKDPQLFSLSGCGMLSPPAVLNCLLREAGPAGLVQHSAGANGWEFGKLTLLPKPALNVPFRLFPRSPTRRPSWITMTTPCTARCVLHQLPVGCM
jgi:hypothetical protein